MALSLTEDLKRPSGRLPNKRGWLQDQDEYLEKEIRDAGTIPSYPAYPPSNPPYILAPCYSKGYRICGGCNLRLDMAIIWGAWDCTSILIVFDVVLALTPSSDMTHEFSLSGRDPYHKIYFRELTYPKCEVCHQFIPTNSAGLIEYKSHPFWLQKYCPSHEFDNTARCSSCERLEALLSSSNFSSFCIISSSLTMCCGYLHAFACLLAFHSTAEVLKR